MDIPDRFIARSKTPVFFDILFDETVRINEARGSFAIRRRHSTNIGSTTTCPTPEVEKYPGLIVPGPMQATMLIEAAQRRASRVASSFRFRVVHPMFHDRDLRLGGRREPGAPAIELGTATPEGHLGMQARMEWA